MNKIITLFLTSVLFISAKAQTKSTWYEYLNSKIKGNSTYLIGGSSFLSEYNFEYRAYDIESFEPKYHQPTVYYKPNNKQLLLWDDTKEKISSIEFDEINSYPFNNIIVKVGNYYGVIDTTGSFILPPKYLSVRIIDPCDQNCEGQMFYLEEPTAASNAIKWSIVYRSGQVVLNSDKAKTNSYHPQFTHIDFIYFNNSVHYVIETLSGNDNHFTVGVLGQDPLYTKPGQINYITSLYRNNTWDPQSFESTKYLSSGFNQENGIITEVDLAEVQLNNPDINSEMHNGKIIFNLNTSEFLTDFGGYKYLQELNNQHLIDYGSSSHNMKWIKLNKCTHKDGEIIQSYGSKNCNDLYGIFDLKLKTIIPFGMRDIEQFTSQNLEDFFISKNKDKEGLIHKDYGVILNTEFQNIVPIASSVAGKYWEVDLESGFVKIYDFSTKSFLFNGQNFDSIISKNGICYGLIDGKEYQLFPDGEKDPDSITVW